MVPEFSIVSLLRRVLYNLGDEPITSTMYGFDEAWRLRIIIENLAKLTNSDFEDGFTDKGSWPDGVEKFLFRDQLARMPDEMVEYGEGLRPEFYFLRASPQTFIARIQAKGIEDDTFSVRHSSSPKVTETLRRIYDLQRSADYCLLLMSGWQLMAAFVVQFRPETNINAGRFEGRVEHVATHRAIRFHSLDELLGFITNVLTEVRDSEQH